MINPTGWKCPYCGRVNAPHIDCCPCSVINPPQYPVGPYYPETPWVQPWVPWDWPTDTNDKHPRITWTCESAKEDG